MTTETLTDMVPQKDFFIGIDSDGCAFDTMEVKHKECFIPNIIKHWHLQAVSKYAREAAEFVNLYSKWRGINRWPALVMAFDLLADWPEVQARKVAIPQATAVRAFIADDDFPKSDAGLKAYMQKFNGPELDTALAWTLAVNETVADMVHGVPPFPFMAESLIKLAQSADAIVCSATPTEALIREWEEHDIAQYVRVIAGQELGKKAVHLKKASGGKYKPGHTLMIGDAPGDFDAARANEALFYPINPGHEDESWERFYTEGLDKFLNGQYAGVYEAALIADFEKLLPDTPPWAK